jgi:enoyl-CoA hydratase/carnithine racemase
VPIPEVQFTSEGRVAFLTFNRPEARNAMTWPMYDALVEACDLVDADRRIGALVLRGAGDAFVAGTDISQFSSFSSADDGIAYERRMERVIERLEQVSVPTIARVHGVAAGGGCLIALACDLRVCSPAARFGVPIARTLGNCLSAANCARLVAAIGPARSKELLFTGRLLDATEALSLGLATRVAAVDALDAAVRELAETIADNAPLTLRAAKEAIRRIALRRRVEDGFADDLTALCYGSQDFHEGVAAFLAKRKPQFTGS